MHNLFKINSHAWMEGYYRAAGADEDLFARYGRGILATTGCPSGEVQTLLRLGRYEAARESAAKFRDIFGADNYFVEVMFHGLDIERRVLPDLLRLSADLNLPLVATNDSHYVRREDARGHDTRCGASTPAPTWPTRNGPVRGATKSWSSLDQLRLVRQDRIGDIAHREDC